MSTKSGMRDWSGIVPTLRETLENAGGPKTASELRATLPGGKKPSLKDMQDLLEAQVAQGSIHRWTTGKTTRYWSKSPEAVARQALPEGLQKADEPWSVEHYRKALQLNAEAALVKTLLEALAGEGRCIAMNR